MTPSGHIRRDLRSDNRGGLRIVIEDVEHILPLTAAPCLYDRTRSGMTPLYDPDPAYLARKDEVREVWAGRLDICKVVSAC